MKNIFFPHFPKLCIFFVVLHILIIKTNSLINFIYPYSFTLTNGNIFIIHKTGITICNGYYSKIISNVLTFSANEEITLTTLSKITTVFEDDYIFSTINLVF